MVVAGIAVREGRLLLARRPAGGAHAGLWEFPGGKVEEGEGPLEALDREWKEELGVTVAAAEPFSFATGEAGDRPLVLLFYKVTAFAGDPEPLLAGSSIRWSPAPEASLLAMPAPDAPVLAALLREGGGAFLDTAAADRARALAEAAELDPRIEGSESLRPGQLLRFVKRPTRSARRLGGILLVAGGKVLAFENLCPHVPVPLDRPGEEVVLEGGTIVCGQHAATFDAGTGLCTGGPCSGDHLRPIPLAPSGGGWAVDWAGFR
jgi:8-oxo-dGTP diphosphatase